MKINTKDYKLPKLINIVEDVPIFEEILDPLSNLWNNLHLLNAAKDEYQDLKTNLNFCKVEIDTLNTTYDLLNKGILKQVDISYSKEKDTNINIIRPCIEYLNKGIEILKNRKKEDIRENDIFFYIKFKDQEFVYKKSTNEYFEEQEFINEYYIIKIKKEEIKIDNNSLSNVDINNRTNDNIKYSIYNNIVNDNIDNLTNKIKKLGDFIINNNIKIDRNINMINLYVSKMYIKTFLEDNEIVNYGNILEDGYGEIVFLIGKNIYKIIRNPNNFKIYKNEKFLF